VTRGQRRVGLTYLFAGAMHFVAPRPYRAIMPDYLPAHRELVAASGVAEMAGGAGILCERTRVPAAWWMIATLVAVFPANVHMAVHRERYERFPAWALYARLPLQAVFIWDVWRTAIRADPTP
jgi:uncharacterized membrane protein